MTAVAVCNSVWTMLQASVLTAEVERTHAWGLCIAICTGHQNFESCHARATPGHTSQLHHVGATASVARPLDACSSCAFACAVCALYWLLQEQWLLAAATPAYPRFPLPSDAAWLAQPDERLWRPPCMPANCSTNPIQNMLGPCMQPEPFAFVVLQQVFKCHAVLATCLECSCALPMMIAQASTCLSWAHL